MTEHRTHASFDHEDSFVVKEKDYRVLEAICDTIIPTLAKDGKQEAFWKRKASDLDVPNRLLEVIALQSPKEQKAFLMLLKLFSNAFAGLFFTGTFANFLRLPEKKRTLWLQKMSRSPFQPLRAGFTILKKLSCFVFYAIPESGKINPNWEAIGYPGPISAPPKVPKPIKPLYLSQAKTISCEVLVVGSGAGGGVVAGQLANAGKDVIIVEKGSYLNEADFTQQEYEMMELYERKGALSTQDNAVTVLAGSCLGGGTTLNWAGTIRTPQYVLEEWASKNNVPDFTSVSYRESLDAAEKAISTNTHAVKHNEQNQKLWKGSTQLGHLTKDIPQNIVTEEHDDQRALGYSCMGDQYGHKQSMLNTYLDSANTHGASFLVNTEVQKVIIKNGKAIGVEAIQKWSNGSKHTITVHAEKVVLAAGALHTPAILMRSGVNHPAIGSNLYLHPVANVSAFYEDKINSWWGGMMTVANDQFVHLDGNYGFKMETPPTHPGIMGMSMQWESGEQHKKMMLKAPHLCSFIVLTRDKFGGKIRLDQDGQPSIHYQMNPYDLKHLIEGVKQGILVHQAAGAEQVMTPHNDLLTMDKVPEKKLDEILRNLSWKRNKFNLFSAHQMGTCRIGGKKKLHPTAPNGELYQVKNLYVADTSAFPNASGANPMLSVEALAHYIAKGMV